MITITLSKFELHCIAKCVQNSCQLSNPVDDVIAIHAMHPGEIATLNELGARIARLKALAPSADDTTTLTE